MPPATAKSTPARRDKKSTQESERLQRLDDAYWADRADKAFAQGDWMSVEESEKFLQEMLDAPDTASKPPS